MHRVKEQCLYKLVTSEKVSKFLLCLQVHNIIKELELHCHRQLHIRVILLIFIQNFVVISLLVVIKMSANLLSSNAGVSPIRFAETSDKTPHPGRLYISLCLCISSLCIWIFGLLDLRSQLVTHARTHVLTDVRRGFSNPLYV